MNWGIPYEKNLPCASKILHFYNYVDVDIKSNRSRKLSEHQ